MLAIREFLEAKSKAEKPKPKAKKTKTAEPDLKVGASHFQTALEKVRKER